MFKTTSYVPESGLKCPEMVAPGPIFNQIQGKNSLCTVKVFPYTFVFQSYRND